MAEPLLAVGGLTTREAESRLLESGPNLLTPANSHAGALRTFTRALTDPMAILLLVASPTYAVLGDYASAAFTAAAIVPVTAIDLLLEQRAESALQRLREMTAPTARVIRDSVERIIATELVVPGDAVLLQEGDIVPADAELVEGLHLVTARRRSRASPRR